MVCAQDDRKLRIIALLVDTPGYDELMLSKSAAEQLTEKTELIKHFEERNELASERERELQEQVEEQARKIRRLQHSLNHVIESVRSIDK